MGFSFFFFLFFLCSLGDLDLDLIWDVASRDGLDL